MRILRLKVAGRDVATWQTFLRLQGYDPGPTDDYFGRKTKQATMAFQAVNGLTVDGVVANETFAKAMACGFQPLPDVQAPSPSEDKRSNHWIPVSWYGRRAAFNSRPGCTRATDSG